MSSGIAKMMAMKIGTTQQLLIRVAARQPKRIRKNMKRQLIALASKTPEKIVAKQRSVIRAVRRDECLRAISTCPQADDTARKS